MSPQTFNETFALMIGTKRKKEPRGGRNSEERRKTKLKYTERHGNICHIHEIRVE